MLMPVATLTETPKAWAELFHAAFEQAADGVIITDRDNLVAAINPAAATLLGQPAQDLTGASCCDIFGKEKPCQNCWTRQVLSRGQTLRDQEVTISPRNGGRRTLLVTATPLVAANGVSGAVYLMRDADTARLVNQRLRREALSDELTGLANRRQWDRSLPVEAARARRHRRSLSLLMIDIDGFKQYNDRHGHQAGDEVLRTVGKLLRVDSREEDVIARYGGEEFAVLLPECGPEQARQRAERLRREVAAWPFKEGPVTISLGIASADGSEETKPHALVHRADLALYQAKQAGKNRAVSFGSGPNGAAGSRPAGRGERKGD